jgi:hypothetical protein
MRSEVSDGKIHHIYQCKKLKYASWVFLLYLMILDIEPLAMFKSPKMVTAHNHTSFQGGVSPNLETVIPELRSVY